VGESSPAWSPDGSKLAFTREYYGPGYTEGTVLSFLGEDIFVMNADGSGLRRLTFLERDSEPVWSPDGRRIAFLSGNDIDNSIRVMNSDGSAARDVCSPSRCGQGVAELSWSPDGTTLVFSHRGVLLERGTLSRPSAISLIGADGRGLRNLTNTNCPPICSFDAGPAWSPDGKRVAFGHDPFRHNSFESFAGPGSNVYVMNADGTNSRKLAHCPEPGCSQYLAPSWSPDGTKILFFTVGEFSGFQPLLTVLRLDGSSPQSFAPCATLACDGIFGGTWSPDGALILFEAKGMYLVNVDGTGVRSLAGGGGATWQTVLRTSD
jgi:Tol biopolymer transport system component